MKIIVPCAGRSSRYPDMPPKWMLPDPGGIPMIVRAVEALGATPDNLIVTILREHEERFDARRGLRSAFGFDVETVVLDEQTSSQSETVARTLRSAGVDEPFLVKDADNRFGLSEIEATTNYVSVASLNEFDMINARNKSYIDVVDDDIVRIVEKKVISDLFSVGGYFFVDPAAFLATFERLDRVGGSSERPELYLSAVIDAMLEDGERFVARRAEGFEDWGTVHEWRRMLESRTHAFLSLDGFLFERGFEHFSPRFETVSPYPRAVDAAKALHAEGHSLSYLSIRPERLRDMTRRQMAAAGLPEGDLLMNCDLSQWTMVTAPHASMPLSTVRGLELAPDDPALHAKLSGKRG